MNEREISTPEELDAALIQQELEKHKKLWRTAQQGPVSGISLIGIIASAAMMFAAVMSDSEDLIDRIFMGGLGIVLFLQFQLHHAQSKNEAIAKLLKRLEQRVTRLERKTYSDD